MLLKLRLLVLFGLWIASVAHAETLPSAAFYYGPDIPWNELSAFDMAVIEPGQAHSPPADQVGKVYAYVSLGEVQPSRPYAAGIKDAWRLGVNRDWNSVILDLSNPDLRHYLIENVIRPLWDKGYRHFFFDTLDSYQRAVPSQAGREAQRQGLETLINQIAETFPGATFILNRGFELLPAVHKHVDAVAAESLYRGWLPGEHRYQDVSQSDRKWLLDRFKEARQRYGIPGIAIDYVPPTDRDQARAVAKKIRADGVIPWVTDPALDMMGVGEIEVMPRKVLMIHDTPQSWLWESSELVRYAEMPLQYLGLVPDIRFVGDAMPGGDLRGRYAGIVTWLDGNQVPPDFQRWLARQAADGVPVVMLGHLAVDPDGRYAAQFGFKQEPEPKTPPRVVQQAKPMAFEAPLPSLVTLNQPVTLTATQARVARPWLTLAADGHHYTAVALTSWGGFAEDPFTVRSILPVSNDENANRWMLQPITFFRQALRLPAMPVPDVSTENGRRLLMVHMDGDGFANLAAVKGYRNQPAGEVILQEIVKHYHLPMTLSVIEGEVAKDGLYPQHAKEFQAIARHIFAQPNVEAATHTYSHPFDWHEALAHPDTAKGPDGDLLRLPVPDYTLNLTREIVGSADYINSELLPPGKKTRVILWSGDTTPPVRALDIAHQAGLLNMNGGDTEITDSAPSWTLIKGLGIPKGDQYQVFAPDTNENLYTDDWHGPYYGFERVLETFRLTGEPIRFKPVDIYFHTYSGSKNASLYALKQVLDWAVKQPFYPLFVSDYIKKVLDFNDMVIARRGDDWVIHGDGALRTLRVPDGVSLPDMAASTGIAGYHTGDPATYVSLSGGDAVWRPGPHRSPALWAANGRLTDFEKHGHDLRLFLKAEVPLRFTLIQPPGCQLYHGDKPWTPVAHQGDRYQYRSDRDADQLRLQCRP